MEKDLKRAYKYLRLTDLATQEEVEARKNALIKIAKAKRFEGKDYEDEIEKINDAAKIVSSNLGNEQPIETNYKYESSNESIVSLTIALIFVLLICLYSFYVLL